MNRLILEKWHDHGGWSFAFPPSLPAQTHPAIWRISDAPSVIIYQDTAGDFDEASIHSMLRHYEVLRDRTTSEGRHLVLGDGRRRHRILLLQPCFAGSGYLVPQDQLVRIRLDAIDAFDWSCRQYRYAKSNDALLPSVYQKRRLTLLLKILDAMHGCENGCATTREIAKKVVYRNTDLGRAIEWKSSSQRRQAQRLINEARIMVDGGYRWLLKGRMPPRNPNP
nr:DUF2285 domain-containing protein [uncultured Sphingorhabdus sp.]